MSRLIAMILLVNCLVGSGGCARAEVPTDTVPHEPIVGLPCEGCEAVFDGIPAILASSSRIAARDEPGEPMRILGTVFAQNGHPAPGVIVYGYHTNSLGIYPTDGRLRGQPGFPHGLLRGWVKTDENGQYRFDTIRPAGYPNTDLPAHVHMHVIEVGRCTYYIDDILFADDPRLTLQKRRELITGRGGSGLVSPQRDVDGHWTVTRDIFLGENISGYPEDSPAPIQGRFEIFLLRDTTVRVTHYDRTTLKDLPLAESPWITAADISSYDWETHEIILKAESAGLMGRFQDQITGLDIPFVVVANGKRIYMGQFPWMPSSFIGRGPLIFKVDGDKPGVRIGPPIYPGETDPRNDERIKRCLNEAGLLKP